MVDRFFDRFDEDEDEPNFDRCRIIQHDSLVCEECGNVCDSNGGEIICMTCGSISESHYDEYVSSVSKRHEGFTHEQRKMLAKKLTWLNNTAGDRGVRPFTDEILNTAADYFAKLRENTEETRSQKMRERIGACLYYAAHKYGCGRPRKEIAKFCMIPKNINESINLISMMEKSGIDIVGARDADTRVSQANTICMRCEIRDKDKRDKICETMIYILHVAEEEHLIAISAMYDSKVTAATYISMRLHGEDISLDQVSKASDIRCDTLLKIVNEVKKHINLFSFDDIGS